MTTEVPENVVPMRRDSKKANGSGRIGRQREPATIFSTIARWAKEGRLVHESIGIAKLDELTGGGPVYGTRWVLVGAPDAGKTALLIQCLARAYEQGIAVGILATDLDADDVVTRLMQRLGFTREQCEERSPRDLEDMRDRLGSDPPLKIYDMTWTIEKAAENLAAFARRRAEADPAAHPNGPRAFLGVDSIQTARCDLEAESRSTREAVTMRVNAMRDVAAKHRMIVFATSEMNRDAYRTAEAAENANDLASAKESGALEYSARVMLAVRSVKDETDMVEIRVAKNKHGPAGEKVFLRLNRRLQELTETDAPERVDRSAEREQAMDARAKARNVEAAAALVRALLEEPGIGRAKVTGAIRAELGRCGTTLADAAVSTLGQGLYRQLATKGKREHLFLDGRRIPPQVLAALPPEVRAKAAGARPPQVPTPTQTDLETVEEAPDAAE